GAVMEAGVPIGAQPGPDPDDVPTEATVLRMLLGAQLRRLREAEGISPERAGYEIRASRSKISRMETGRVGFKVRDVEDLLTVYGVTDGQQRSEVIALARLSSAPNWWAKYGDILPAWFETYLGLESTALTIRSFEVQFVPGLFQTEDYARAVTRLGHRPRPPRPPRRRDRTPGRPARQAPGPADPAGTAPGLGGHRRGGAAPTVRRRHGDAGPTPPPPRGGGAAARDPPGRPVHPRRPRRRERGVLDPALPGAGPARRGLHRAAHQRPVPGPATGRRALPGGRRPAERRGADPRGNGGLHRAGRPGDMTGTGRQKMT